jgi:hypothetical protein
LVRGLMQSHGRLFVARVAAFSLSVGSSIAVMPAECTKSTKPKGRVWEAFTKVPAQSPGGPEGYKCKGASNGCTTIYFQKTPNATTLATHASKCKFLSADLRDLVKNSHKIGGSNIAAEVLVIHEAAPESGSHGAPAAAPAAVPPAAPPAGPKQHLGELLEHTHKHGSFLLLY